MMKKVISAVLAFTLVCGTAVSAAGNQNEQTDTLTDITQEEQAVTADVNSSEESSESTESVADDTSSDEQVSETPVPSEESADTDEAKMAGMYFGRSGRYTDGKGCLRKKAIPLLSRATRALRARLRYPPRYSAKR